MWKWVCLAFVLLPALLEANGRRWMAPAPGPPPGIARTGQAQVADSANVDTLTIAGYDTGCGAAENCALIVELMRRGSTTTEACTFGGAAITGPGINDGQGNARLYTVVGTGQNGTGDIVCTWVTARPACLIVMSYRGVDQTNPLGSPANQDSTKGNSLTAPQLTLTGTAATSVVVDGLNHNNVVGTITVDAGQTEIFNVDVGDRLSCVASEKPATTPDTTTGMSWATAQQAIYWSGELHEAP